MPVKLDKIPPGEPHLVPIIYKEIQTMASYYQSTNPDETKSGWFSVAEILSLISDNQANGIRFYFGRHDQATGPYPGQLTIILVATRDTVNPDDPATENSNNLLNYLAENGPVASVTYSGLGGDAIPLCPPRCPLAKTNFP